MPDLSPARKPNESFAAYRIRRAAGNRYVKAVRRGYWPSSQPRHA
jgi:hypothetical protein